MSNTSDIQYPMKATCLLSGLPADTLRAWERRYKAVVPHRIRGRRLYSQSDVQRLKLLKWAVDHGHRIGQIARFSSEQLLALQDSTAIVNELPSSEVAPQVQRLIELTKGLSIEADLELSRLAGLMDPREFIFEIILPLMREIGAQWESGELTVAQEHLTSAGVRSVLGTLIRIYSNNPQAPAMIFCTTPDEHHEFGILVAAMIAAINGFRPLYFGPNMPIKDIADSANKTIAFAVVISLSGTQPDPDVKKYLSDLRKLIRHDTNLIVGGHQSKIIPVSHHSWAAPTLEVFEGLIIDLKSRSRAFP